MNTLSATLAIAGKVHFAQVRLLDIFYLVCSAPRFFADPAGHDLVVVRNNRNELVGVMCTERPEAQPGEE